GLFLPGREFFIRQVEAIAELRGSLEGEAGDIVDRPGAAQIRISPCGLARLIVFFQGLESGEGDGLLRTGGKRNGGQRRDCCCSGGGAETGLQTAHDFLSPGGRNRLIEIRRCSAFPSVASDRSDDLYLGMFNSSWCC